MKTKHQMSGMKGVPYKVVKKPGQSRMALPLSGFQGVGYTAGKGDGLSPTGMSHGPAQSNIKK